MEDYHFITWREKESKDFTMRMMLCTVSLERINESLRAIISSKVMKSKRKKLFIWDL